MQDFLINNWFSIVSTILLTAGFLYTNSNSRNALNVSKHANDIAKESIIKTKAHFLETNRPILLGEPVTYKDGNYYFIHKVNSKKIIITLLISITNNGNVIASRSTVEEAGLMISDKGEKIVRKQNYYDNIGRIVNSRDEIKKTNYTLMDIAPNATFIKELSFELNLDESDYNFDTISKLSKSNSLILNIDLRILSYYDQIKDMVFMTHTTHGITSNVVLTLETRLNAFKEETEEKVV